MQNTNFARLLPTQPGSAIIARPARHTISSKKAASTFSAARLPTPGCCLLTAARGGSQAGLCNAMPTSEAGARPLIPTGRRDSSGRPAAPRRGLRPALYVWVCLLLSSPVAAQAVAAQPNRESEPSPGRQAGGTDGPSVGRCPEVGPSEPTHSASAKAIGRKGKGIARGGTRQEKTEGNCSVLGCSFCALKFNRCSFSPDDD